MTLKILNKKEKQEIEKILNERFGVKKIPGILIKRGEERIFLFLGNLSEEKIKEIEKDVFIERAGIYFAKQIKNTQEIRLSIEGSQILKDQITKNIFETDEILMNEWMMGKDLNIKSNLKGFVVIKYRDEFLGCGKASEGRITNFIPKNRRLREK